MKKILFLFILGISMILGSCQKDNNFKVGGSSWNLPQNEIFSIYPTPPGQWSGGNDPIYTPTGRVGDVMPYFEKDTFNVFYLHDANSGKDGFHPWSKFTTTDLTHFHNDGLMIPFGTSKDRDLALGTGSVVKEGDTYYAYYSGVNGNMPSQGEPKDVVLLATAKDLSNWTKQKDFLMKPETANGYDKLEFRDPYVFFNKEKNEYWMLLCGRKDGKAAVMLYTCDDLASNNWQLQNPVYTDAKYYVPECPQIFKWGDFWYLIFSDNSVEDETHYRIATSSEGPWTKPDNDIFDGKYMYASKVAMGNDHTYLFGWVPYKSGLNDFGDRRWGGNLVVHELVQNEDGNLKTKLPKKIANVFTQELPLKLAMKEVNIRYEGNEVQFQGVNNNEYLLFDRIKGQKMITATVSNLKANSKFGLLFGMRNKGENTDYYKIAFDVNNGTVSGIDVHNGNEKMDAHVPFAMNPQDSYEIKVVIDGSVCVVYLNDEIALSSRIYSLDNNFWGIYTDKGNVEFKDIRLIKP